MADDNDKLLFSQGLFNEGFDGFYIKQQVDSSSSAYLCSYTEDWIGDNFGNT